MQVGKNPRNTVFDAKRLIGSKVTEPVIREDMKHWPFEVRVRVRVRVSVRVSARVRVRVGVGVWVRVRARSLNRSLGRT